MILLCHVQFHLIISNGQQNNSLIIDVQNLPLSLTVVGEARLAETHEQVLLDFIRRHELGANGTVEAWRGKNAKRKH